MKTKQLTEYLYDVIKECALNKNQKDEWAKLSHKHANEAKFALYPFLNPKNITCYHNTIQIGKYITITITDSRMEG